MIDYINKLNEATKRICVSYRLGFDMRGNPTIGVRGAIDRNMMKDMVIIDGIAWLIAGDLFDHEDPCNAINSIRGVDPLFCNPSNLVVVLTAQSVIAGKVVQVNLGTRQVIRICRMSEDSGLIDLKDVED